MALYISTIAHTMCNGKLLQMAEMPNFSRRKESIFKFLTLERPMTTTLLERPSDQNDGKYKLYTIPLKTVKMTARPF